MALGGNGEREALVELADGLGGLTLAEAQLLTAGLGLSVEIAKPDDSGLTFVTGDYRENRLRLGVENGLVVWAGAG